MPGCCFSIERDLLEGKMAARSEVNVFIRHDGVPEVTERCRRNSCFSNAGSSRFLFTRTSTINASTVPLSTALTGSAGISPTFWVANIMELFERLAYYGQQIVFMVYLRDVLGIQKRKREDFPVCSRDHVALSDCRRHAGRQVGFRRAFTIAFTIWLWDIFSSVRSGWSLCRRVRHGTAAGPAHALPDIHRTGRVLHQTSVLGTVAVTTTEDGRSSDLPSITGW